MIESLAITTVFIVGACMVTTPLLLAWLVWGREKYAADIRSGFLFPHRFMRPSTAVFLAVLIVIGVLEICRSYAA